jgi:non-ribosomal peptide synthetase component F
VFSGDVIRALCSSAKLVLCPRGWLLEPEKLYKLMLVEKIDSAEFVPAVLRNLVEYLQRTQQNLHLMKLLVVGSDSLYIQEYQEFQRFCGEQTRLINSYGVTEACIDSTYFELGIGDWENRSPTSLRSRGSKLCDFHKSYRIAIVVSLFFLIPAARSLIFFVLDTYFL